MTLFYEFLSPNKKKSLLFSMRYLTKDFLESYQYDLTTFNNENEAINDLYFYWLRHSAERNYQWCQDLKLDIFSEGFTKEMKQLLCSYFQLHFTDSAKQKTN